MMELEPILDFMTENAERIHALLEEVTEEQARWKPAPDAWSMLEVINHLADEEREDFRPHLGYILEQSSQPWPLIDPQGWVTQRKYNERDPNSSLADYLAERQLSLQWLRSLTSPDWELAVTAPWGQLKAGDMLAAWAAHDLLQMRQLVELHWAYHQLQVAPYSTQYAGPW